MLKHSIDIVGPSYNNKGDQLMVKAVEEQLGENYNLFVGGRWKSSRLFRKLILALHRRLPNNVYFLKYRLSPFMPYSFNQKFEWIGYDDIHAVFDCSGFQYGDQWVNLVKRQSWRALHYKKIKYLSKKIVFLPQAMGPFKNISVKNIAKEIFEQANLIYARDKYSFTFLKNLHLRSPTILLGHDISILVGNSKNTNNLDNNIAIVPNGRMLDMTKPSTSKNYLLFINNAIIKIISEGFTPVFLIHEKYDFFLVKQINNMLKMNIEVLDLDALSSKEFLGNCYAVISSRFHAIVGSLSQSVLTLGTGWSHKYEAIFREYDCKSCLINDISSSDEVNRKLGYLFNLKKKKEFLSKISEKAHSHKITVSEIWNNIKNELSY